MPIDSCPGARNLSLAFSTPPRMVMKQLVERWLGSEDDDHGA